MAACGPGIGSTSPDRKDLERPADLMNELEDPDSFYKDWNVEFSLVDFPARIDGQEVFLCWRSDMERLAWHPFIEGDAARQPIPEGLFYP